MISICILTKNSAPSLAATLASVRRFPEVILFDTGSTDATIDIGNQFSNVVVHQTYFSGFGPLRNQAASLASHDWILAIDSDEILSSSLQEEILSLKLNPQCIYEIDFHNYYNGKRILGCGWHPESHIRLYNRRFTRFSDSFLHESVLQNGLTIQKLRHPILHTPYRSISDFLSKMQHYSDLFAKQNERRKSSFSKAIWHGFGAFFTSYFIKRGCLCGKEGFIISFYNANMAYYKYLKLAEKTQI